MMLKQEVSVPDLWSDTLATSSVILVDRIESLSAPLPPDQHLANPYVLGGTTRLVPRSDRTFRSSEELSTFFLIYNVGLTSGGLPDVMVEFNFHTTGPDGDEFFNTSGTQTFNAQTLPDGFDYAGGHQLQVDRSCRSARSPRPTTGSRSKSRIRRTIRHWSGTWSSRCRRSSSRGDSSESHETGDARDAAQDDCGGNVCHGAARFARSTEST